MKPTGFRLLNASNRLRPAPSRRLRSARKFVSSLEPLEARELLAAGFLQGTAFVDGNGNSVLDPGEALAGAKIALYQQVGSTYSHIGTDQTTLADGRYLFTGLDAGTYQIVETPPTNYANEGTQVLSQLNPAAQQAVNTIEVTLLDPGSLNATLDNGAFFARNLFDFGTHDFYGANIRNSAGQLPITVNSSTSQTSTSFLTLCVDLHQNLSGGNTVDHFQVLPSPTPTGQSPPPQNWDRVAYLYNHYGTADLSKQDAVGLQFAIWELLYDGGETTPDFNGGNFGNFAGILPYTDSAEVTAV
ncbi:MAG: SdrD B-like domain-containing protein, partial [Isosphaeraceae bacterium]